MKIPQQSKVVSGQISADATTASTKLVTEWMLAAGGAGLILGLDQRQLSGAGAWTGYLRWRFAKARTDQPEGWSTSTTARTTADGFVELVDISGTTDMLWLQGALSGQASGGAAELFARLQAQVDGKGVVLGSLTTDIQPVTNSGQSQYIPVPGRFPSGGLTKLMFAYVFSGVSGTITYRPVWRESKLDADYPANWSPLGSADVNRTTDGFDNSGQLAAVPTSGYSHGQAGLRVSGDARGRIEIIVAGIY